ncbi:CMD domain protein [Paraburkholderia kirstenboschensis]|uniref:CMD domain protein n=1 Tax=Paraburkholderia kirstenboschensis TaxID=1245436 RepID=A0ABZ0EI50_9BURK|nr:CMD domain protein [Paraburkholderia kirstenboschensis]WOD16089.1 CMD domain protein [Paraburkholderia kirstenboschensis]
MSTTSRSTPVIDTADVVSQLSGLAADGDVAALRAARAEATRYTQGSYDALFSPDVVGLTLDERLYAAWYAAWLTPSVDAARFYRERLLTESHDRATHAAALDRIVASGPAAVDDTRLAAILAHTHLLITRAAIAGPKELSTLQAAGLTTPAIVALSQLMAFVSYQVRLVATLRAMNDPKLSDGNAGAPREDVSSAHAFTADTLGWKAWLNTVSLDQATPEQLAVLEASHPKAKTSDYYLLLVHQPEILRERSGAFNSIMYAPGGLSRAERELASTVVSRVNGCVYCASVHAQRFIQLARRDDVIGQVFANPDTAGTTERERAIVRYSIELTVHPDATDNASLEALRAVGLSSADIWDLSQAVAIFAWANRLMLSSGEPVFPQ